MFPQDRFFFSMALPAHSGPRPLIQFRNHFSLLGRVISPSQGRYLNTGQYKHRINAYTHQTSMSWVGFEPTIPASERAKTVHALRCPYTYESGLRVLLGLGSNEPYSSVCVGRHEPGSARRRLAIGSYVCGWSRVRLSYPHGHTHRQREFCH
jgi:hypothetical protein